ncbi:FadR/GntR family transcriptional regulator [Neisseriaceae bacterium B1]
MNTELIRQPSLGNQLASILEQRIVQNIYPVHSKLPPERQLAEEFNVSRPSVRAAIHILATRGLIETRQGDGNYVSDDVGEQLQFGWESVLNDHPDIENQLLDFRSGVESMMASVAAQSRTDSDLQRMRYWLTQLAQAYEQGDVDKQSKADVAFHQAIAEATHNVLFTRLSDSLLRLMQKQTKRNLGNMFGARNTMHADLSAQHEAIFQAIAQQNATLAAQTIQTHLNYVKESLQRQRAAQINETHAQALALSEQQRESKLK